MSTPENIPTPIERRPRNLLEKARDDIVQSIVDAEQNTPSHIAIGPDEWVHTPHLVEMPEFYLSGAERLSRIPREDVELIVRQTISVLNSRDLIDGHAKLRYVGE